MRPLLHVVHYSVPSPIACSIRIVYTVCRTVRGWEGLQVCVCVRACVGVCEFCEFIMCNKVHALVYMPLCVCHCL